MNDYFFRKIMQISERTNESESIQHFKLNLENIAKCLYQDLEMNRFKNIDKIMILIRNLTKQLFEKRIKQITVILFEFLLNVLISITGQVDIYFFDFFDPIVLFYDDYDNEIKNACNLLNKVLLDSFISQVEKISKHYVVVKSIIKKIQLVKNENVRILILEWIYVIDSFPCFDISYIFDQIVSDLIYLFSDDNIEIVRLVKDKIRSIIKRHQFKNRIENKKIFKILKNVYLISTQFEKSKNRKNVENNIFIILMEYFQIFINQMEDLDMKFSKILKVDLNLVFEVFSFMLEVYLKKYKVQTNLNFKKKFFKKIKNFILNLKNVMTNQIVINMKKFIVDSYKNYVKTNNSSDFDLFFEINGFLKVFSKFNKKIELTFIRALTKLFWYILKNNQDKFNSEKFQYFLSEKISLILEELFVNDENAFEIFLKNLVYIIFENKKQIFLKPVFIHLLWFFRKNLELYEILQLFTQCSIFYNQKKFLRFLFEEMIKETLPNTLKISNFIFQKNSTLLTNTLFNNPIWFLLINISLRNFEFCCNLLKFLIEKFNFFSLESQINFSNKITTMLSYLEDVATNMNFNQNFFFLEFISIALMIIPQNKIFFKFQDFLRNYYLLIKKKDFKSDPQQLEYFNIYINFFQKKNNKKKEISNSNYKKDSDLIEGENENIISVFDLSKQSETFGSNLTYLKANSHFNQYHGAFDDFEIITPFSELK